MQSAVVLLSGGLDSGTAMAMWLADGNRASLCLTADYGQRSSAREQAAARALADRYEVPWLLLELPWLAEASARAGSALVPGDVQVPRPGGDEPGDAESAASVWVPARNVVLLAAAASWAEARGASHVLAGFNREEAQHFPDNSEAFVAAMDEVLQLGTRTGVVVTSPTLGLSKVEIVARARAMGLQRSDFWSCYEGGEGQCGVCESCRRSERAWRD